MSTTDPEATHDCDRDVAVVGGGPAGCSAAV
ncbi:thioredoxin reductase, partial [Halorubrum sp. SS5]